MSCEFPATMHGLKQWYTKMFEQLGWMVLAKEYRYDDKTHSYHMSLQRLKEKLECKINSIRNEDKRDDLKIMHKNVVLLIKHVKKAIA
jgi:hypothetical protein